MAILYGTTGDGTTLPVLVDQFGNLLAKGIDGEPGTPGTPGPPGPPGADGGDFPLPPGATDGALLGWQDGELVWITEPFPPVAIAGFRPIIYKGNGGTQSITGVGFSPDLVWIKQRTGTEYHCLADTVRGSVYSLASNSTDVEENRSNRITSFDDGGFSVGNSNTVNTIAQDYIAWCWDAGDTTVTNNNGTIESQVRSNGNFSVVTYTGTGANGTVGHELNSEPKFILLKNYSSTIDWFAWHHSLLVPNQQGMYLNLAADVQNFGYGSFNNTVPSSSVISLGTSNEVNSGSMVAYCWAEVPGVSSFGSYLSTGSRQFISVGFLPSLVIIKSIETGHWFMFDNARGVQRTLRADLSDSEDQTGVVEFVNDGFQLLFSLPGVNQANVTYIYAAFANPSDAAFARKQMRRDAYREERQQNETQPRLRQ